MHIIIFDRDVNVTYVKTYTSVTKIEVDIYKVIEIYINDKCNQIYMITLWFKRMSKMSNEIQLIINNLKIKLKQMVELV